VTTAIGCIAVAEAVFPADYAVVEDIMRHCWSDPGEVCSGRICRLVFEIDPDLSNRSNVSSKSP
jgi:hypothetical protein